MQTTTALQQSDTFQTAIIYLNSRGWEVDPALAQSSDLVQLKQQKRFSTGAFFLTTFFSLGTLFWAYPLYHFARRPKLGTLQDMGDSRIVLTLRGKRLFWNGKNFTVPQ